VEHKRLNIYQRLRQWIRGLSKIQFTALIAITVLLCLGSAGALYLRRLSDMEKVFKDIDWTGEDNEADSPDMNAAFSGQKIINIALLGHDSNDARVKKRRKGYTGLVDANMVAAVNIETGEVNIVSIPRDSYVPIYKQGKYKDKLAHANFFGWRKGIPGIEDKVEAGLITQVETISNVLGGVPIHFYVSLDMEAVREIVDIIGGVWYDVPKRTYHKSGRIIAEPGYQRLSGKKFLDYVRSRVDGGDYQRAKKQQNVMVALFQQFKQTNQLVNVPQILLSMNNKIRTNLSLEQIASLALFGTRKVDSKNIATHTVEGTLTWGAIPGRPEGNNYYLIDHKQRVQLIEEIWGKVVELGPPDILLPAKKKSKDTEIDSDDPSYELEDISEP